MQTGWRLINGSWYYLLENGIMNTDNIILDNRYYTFYDTGKLLSTEILISRQGQQKSEWCWAACAVMIGTYHTNIHITQKQVVEYIKGYDINEGAYPWEVVDAINYASDFGKSAYQINRPLEFNEIVSTLDSNKPFCISMKWFTVNYSHTVVAAGYNLDENTIFIIDPAENAENTYYDYTSLKNGTQIRSGYGYWNYTIEY